MPDRKPLVFPIPPSAPTKACASCGAPIKWITTAAGKRMPVEAEGEKRGEPHWAACPQANQWRRSR